MKSLAFSLVAAASFALSGCSALPTDDAPPSAPIASALTAYSWTLVSGPKSLAPADKVVLTFATDGRASVAGLCNGMGGGYKEEGGKLIMTQFMSTLMACPDARVMSLEGEVGGSLEGSHSWMMTRSEPPQLNVSLANGQRWIFQGARR